MSVEVKEFYDEVTSTLSYVVYDSKSSDSVIIDPVLDFDPKTQSIDYGSIEELLDFVNSKGLNVSYILDTHIHADHLTGVSILKESLPGSQSAIGKGILKVNDYFQKYFTKYNEKPYDILLEDNQEIKAGTMTIKVLETPGHTPSCSSYLIDGNLFTGDLMFLPDSGTGRCDFPNGSSMAMYKSIKEKIYSLPDEFNIFVGHDYAPNGRATEFRTTVGEAKAHNIQIDDSTGLDEFVQKRDSRDKTLSAPRLLAESIQVNINGGDINPVLNGSKITLERMELK